MGWQVLRLTDVHAVKLHRLWQRADAARRGPYCFDAYTDADLVLRRPGAFGVGVFEGGDLVSAAVAMPARADDGRSDVNVPGLAHISSVPHGRQPLTSPVGRSDWADLGALATRSVDSDPLKPDLVPVLDRLRRS